METPKIPPSEVITQPPHVSFGTQAVAPPSPFYVAPNAQLSLNTVANPTVGATSYAVMVRFLRFDGQIIAFVREMVTANGNGTLVMQLAEGFLLNASVRITTSGPFFSPGNFYAFLNIRQVQAEILMNIPLISDYVTPSYVATWPGGQFTQPQQGRGKIRSIVGTDPAAGAEISETVITATRWRLIAFSANLATSAVVGNRRVTLVHDDGANIYARAFLTANIVATTNVSFTFADSYPNAANPDNNQEAPLPAQDYMFTGFRIRTITAGLDPGDNYGPPTYLVEEWVDI